MDINNGASRFASINDANTLIASALKGDTTHGTSPKFGKKQAAMDEDSFISVAESGKPVPDDTKSKKHPVMKFIGTVIGLGATGFAINNKIGFVRSAGSFIAKHLKNTDALKELLKNEGVKSFIEKLPSKLKA